MFWLIVFVRNHEKIPIFKHDLTKVMMSLLGTGYSLLYFIKDIYLNYIEYVINHHVFYIVYINA